MSFELDEVVPVSKGGDPFSRGNVAPAHRICNQRRGNRDLMSGMASDSKTELLSMSLPTSQDW